MQSEFSCSQSQVCCQWICVAVMVQACISVDPSVHGVRVFWDGSGPYDRVDSYLSCVVISTRCRLLSRVCKWRCSTQSEVQFLPRVYEWMCSTQSQVCCQWICVAVKVQARSWFCRSVCAWGACLLGWIPSFRSCGFLFVLRDHLYAVQFSVSSARAEMFDAVRVVRSRKFIVIGFALQSWSRQAVPSIRQCM